MPQRIRWTYPGTDRVVEGSPDKFRELAAHPDAHGKGEPVRVDDAGEPEADSSPAVDGEPAPSEPERAPEDLVSGGDGGWYDVEGLEGSVRGYENALEAAREALED